MILAWWLVVYGTTLVITVSKITAPLRWLVATVCQLIGGTRFGAFGAKAIACSMCVGWWIGLAVWRALPGLCPVVGGRELVVALANAFASSAACWITHVVLARLGAEAL